MTRAPSLAVAAAALGLAVLAPGAAAQDPAALLQAASQAPANPPESVVSDQYREIETVVTEALPAAPAPKPAAPPPAPAEPAAAPEPEYHPKPQQYHSEPASDVTVTQSSPQNVNVSIRINSPGDDGPVTQINNTGSVSAPAPEPARPRAPESPPSPAGALEVPAGPDTWEWIWTSACFGGTGGPAAAAAASSRWVWRWSCGEASLPRVLTEGLSDVADEVGAVLRSGADPGWPSVPGAGLAGELLAPLADQKRGAARRARPEARRSGAAAAGPLRRERPPPGVGSAPAAHDGFLAAIASPPTLHAAAVDAAPPARPKAQARPLDDTGSSSPSGDGGLAAGAATGSGGAVSLLLAGCLAVLASALGFALPRLWLRRWSGPAWRLPWPRGPRLERPG